MVIKKVGLSKVVLHTRHQKLENYTFSVQKMYLCVGEKKSVPLPDFAVDMFSSSEAVVLVDFFLVLYWWLFIPPIPFVCSTYLLYWVTELSCLSLTALRG